MRQIAAMFAPLLVLLPQSLAAQALPYDFDFAEGDSVATTRSAPADSERLIETAQGRQTYGSTSYGPFRVLDGTRAVLVGVTDADSVGAFEAMLRDNPGVATIELVDCPGTEDDRANLRLGHMIRAHGLATHVPANGWVASGAVDLFLAGTRRSADPSARFAVHSWEDYAGRGPKDYAPNAPKNLAYLDYYRTMGMSESDARAFYAMTNAAPFSRPRSLTTADMARWTRLERSTPRVPIAGAAPPSRGPALAIF